NPPLVIFRIPTDRINWITSSFLIGTFILTLTAVPLYLWYFGIDWFHFVIAAGLLTLTGFSITLGYHRLFAHATFRATLPVRLFVLIFGAAAFENSFLMAIFTFGEGYHNYHHEFQHDYRNGVKPWQWDPTKWLIWTLSKLGLTNGLRRVPREAIQVKEAQLRDSRNTLESAHL